MLACGTESRSVGLTANIIIRDVNETRETQDSKKFLGIENFISHGRESQAAGPHAIFTIV